MPGVLGASARASVVHPADPVRQARHGPVGPRPRLRHARGTHGRRPCHHGRGRLGERRPDGRLRGRPDVDPVRGDVSRADTRADPVRRGGQGGEDATTGRGASRRARSSRSSSTLDEHRRALGQRALPSVTSSRAARTTSSCATQFGRLPGAVGPRHDAIAFMRMAFEIDVRDVVPSINVTDARRPPHRRPRVQRRERHAGSRATSRARSTSSCPARTTPSGSSARRDPRRDSRVPDRRARAGRARASARHRALHRHRRLDRASPRAWRPRAGAISSSVHHEVVRRELERVPRTRGRHRRRRLLRDVRRAGPRDPFRRRRSSSRCATSASRFAPGCTPARSSSPATPCAGSPSTRRPRRVAGRRGRGARLADGEGSRRRLGHRVRGPRSARAQGYSGRVASLRSDVASRSASATSTRSRASSTHVSPVSKSSARRK